MTNQSLNCYEILVVEDSPANRLVLVHFLKRLGMRVVECKNGVEALDYLKRQIPDLVLSDRMMPEMTGDDLLRALRAKGEYKHIPFYLVTALDEALPEDLGGLATGLLFKPVQFDVLKDLLSKLQNFKRTG